MRRFIFFSVLMLFTSAGLGCAPATPPAAQPTTAPGISPLPTHIVVTLPSPGVPTPAAKPTPEGGTVTVDETLTGLVDEAKADLATRANVPPDAITVQSAEPVEWRDSSLGCPTEGQMYAQVITPGYLIVLEANGKEYNYHASRDRVMWCSK